MSSYLPNLPRNNACKAYKIVREQGNYEGKGIGSGEIFAIFHDMTPDDKELEARMLMWLKRKETSENTGSVWINMETNL